MLFFVLFSTCTSSLSPNEFGLMRNYMSGSIGYQVQRGGFHITGPIRGYLPFPAAQVTMEFSAAYVTQAADRLPIKTRTGADPKDPDSGGQPLAISCAIQFQIVPAKLRDVYLAFGSYESAHQRFLLLSGNMVSNTAQEYTPQDFWTRRDVIADRMLSKINETLWYNGMVVATRFEMTKVEFAQSFEDSITSVQVAEQKRVVNEYEQQVQRVVQTISVLKSQNEAAIANISAAADATSKQIRAHANRDAFNLKQGMKATKYAQLKKALGFDQSQLAEYFKIKSIQGQGERGKVIIGLPGVGDLSGSRLSEVPKHEL